MINFIVTSNSTTPYVLIQNAIFILTEGITQTNETNNEAVDFSGTGNNSLYVNGTMVQIGENNAIAGNDPDSEDVTITISQTGTIYGNTDFFAISTAGADTVISNAGYITGGGGIRASGDNTVVYNFGTLTSNFTSLSIVYVVDMSGEDGYFNNAGLVASRYGVEMNNSANFVNSGEITTQETATRFNNAIFENVNFVNSGTISSTNAQAVLGGDGAGTFVNSGDINGVVDLQNGDDILRNSGTITGDVDLGSGTNEVTNTGIIDGEVILATVSGTFTNAGTGLVTGTVTGGTGQDTMTGAEADDVFSGEDGGDLLRGNSGEDTLYGGGDNDILFGGDDDDYISGGADNDLIRGNSGNDILLGGSGVDRIYGGGGDDEITGGRSRDVMRGNGGADTFVFTDANDSTVAEADRIRDFQSGIDQIDISEIESFTFVGSAAFSGTGAEVRFQTTASGLRFEMDVDGNGTVDMRVNMNNISTLTADDFIL